MKLKFIAGIDEAGRGPLAGPVVAAAVTVRRFDLLRLRSDLLNKDSKKLSPKRRKEIFKAIKNHPAIRWGTGRVSEKVIDRINILEATKLAMKRAVEKLKIKNKKLKIDYLILDGNFKINMDIPQKPIIKADEKVFSCSLASIIAKVTRDRIMVKYDKKYPRYGFNIHKGYPTKKHAATLKKYGPCEIHRFSFAPVKNVIK